MTWTDDRRSLVAMSCRILAMKGLVDEITGHVSVRVPKTDEMLIRCRGEDEYGLPFTTTRCIRQVDLDGTGEEITERYSTPIELPIHGEILRSRPDVNCVIHAHPPAVLLCGILGLELRPIYGSFNPESMRIAAKGIPIYSRSVLISTKTLGQELARTLGDKSVCLMTGHGMTVVGTSVEEATIRSLRIDRLAQITLLAAQAGRIPPIIPQSEIDTFGEEALQRASPALSSRGTEWVWRHLCGLLAAEDRRLGISDDLSTINR